LSNVATDQDLIDQGEKRVLLRGIFGQTLITNLPIFEEVFKDVEEMLQPGSNLRFDPFKIASGIIQVLRYTRGEGTYTDNIVS